MPEVNPHSFTQHALGAIERTGNRLPDPAMLFVGLLVFVWGLSWLASYVDFGVTDPRSGQPLQIVNQLSGAGIAAAFAGVSGGFSANFIPSAIDPMLQGISQSGAQIIDPDIVLNPLNNYFFTAASSILIVGLGWFITDRFVDPRLAYRPAIPTEIARATPRHEQHAPFISILCA
jgi:aminobenzoyl-glutamate transport protein